MKFSIEKLLSVKEEIKPLIKLHWEQVALNKDKIKLNPDWDEYERLCANGNLKIFTARDDGELVGYYILVVSRSAHYKDHLFANSDIIFVKPDSRQGMTGYKLIKYAEDYLKRYGVSLILANTKIHIPFDQLLERMDYTCIERLYSKYIGE